MIKILPYEDRFEEGVKALFAIPVSGNIVLSLEREPSYLAGAHIQTEFPAIYVAIHEKDGVIGVFNIGTRPIFLKEKIEMVPYFCDLRIHPGYQNGSLFFRMIKYFKQLEIDLDERPAWTVVFGDNERFNRLIEKRNNQKGESIIPLYHRVATIQTHVFKYFKTKVKSNYIVRKANSADIPLMEIFQNSFTQHDYRPYENLRAIGLSDYFKQIDISDYFLAFEKDEIVAYCNIWDTSSMKQTIVQAYSPVLNGVRPIYNSIISKYFGFPILPEVKQALKSLSINQIHIKDRNVDIFKTLLNYISAEKSMKKATYNMMVTLDEKDPLNQVFKSKFNKISMSGYVYLVTSGGAINQFDLGEYVLLDNARI